jgi:predicted RNA-binding Zn ribbon-like protein
VTPDTLLRLANLTVPRKPGRGPRIYPDPLANRNTAAEALGMARLDTAQLRTLRELHKTSVELVDALLAGRPLDRPAARLTRPTATLARQVALELGEIDPKRLKRCALPACDLLFYDTTRSGTRRWHAESPCGARERQRRYRAAASTSSPTQRG